MRKMLFFAALVLLASALFASPAIAAYRSANASGINFPKVRFWNNASSGSWGAETELATAGSPVRYAEAKYSPVSQKIVLVTLSDDGNLDAYVCFSSCGSAGSWTVSNNVGQVWSTAGAQRRFDTAFETATGDLVLAYGVLNSSTSCDLGYKVLPAASASFSGISEGCIDDTTVASDVSYTWVAMAAKPSAASEEILMAGFDSTSTDTVAYRWNGSAWGNLQELSAASSATGGQEALAVAYTTDGSQGMAAGGDSTSGNVATYYWSGSGWVNSADVDLGTSTNDVQWLILKPNPAANTQLMLSSQESGSDRLVSRWNGSAWSAVTTLDGTVDATATRGGDFEWNASGSTGKMVWDTDTTGSTLNVSNWTGSAWSPATYGFEISTYTGTGAWLTMYPNPTATDAMKVLGLRMNSTFRLGSFGWNGAGTFTNYGDAALSANTNVTTFESYSLSFLLANDTSGPSVGNTSVNATSVAADAVICVNATAYDLGGVSAVKAQVAFPNATVQNVTLSDSGCNAGSSGDNWYGASFSVGATAGTLTINTAFANDSFGNTGYQSPYPNLAVSVGAGAFVDTSINASSISFGSLDPGTSNASANASVLLTNTANSNTAVDIYLNNTNMTNGSNSIWYYNTSVHTTNNAAGATNLNGSTFINGTSANTGFVENLGIGSSVSLYFWQDVPPAQPQGFYSATIIIRAVADGDAP